jgi:hypothetical protein
MSSFKFILLTAYCSADQIKKKNVTLPREKYGVPVGKHEGQVITKWTLKKHNARAWTGLVWLRIRTGGRLL